MANEHVFELSNIVKSFPGVVALKNVSIAVRKNEILGLVGENGAGKSTLMKIMIGLHQPDEGAVTLRGKKTALRDPDDAIRHGLGMVFQEGCMIPNLTIQENIFLCHEDKFRSLGFLSKRKMVEQTKVVLERVKLKLDPNVLVGDLSAANKQMVEIARLLWLSRLYGADNPVLILDEPTTVLLEEEANTLFSILNGIKKEASIIFISHRLEEVIRNTDRIIILKDGAFVKEMRSSDANIPDVENLMVGHGCSDDRYHESDQNEDNGAVLLEVIDLEVENKFKPISFSLRAGEIIGLVGLIGSGKEDICRCLAGLEKSTGGEVSVEGRRVHIKSPKDAINAGIGYIPVDRRNDGLALDLNVEQNINLLVLKKFKKRLLLKRRLERENASHWIRENNIKTPSQKSRTANLSGGNQQKVVLSKWLSSDVKVLIVDHPTRGIDVGAKEEIYKRLRTLSSSGMGLIIMCDTLEEDIGLSHRLVILKDGEFVKEATCPKEAKPEPLDIIGAIV